MLAGSQPPPFLPPCEVCFACLFCVGLPALVLACLCRIIFVFQSVSGRVKKTDRQAFALSHPPSFPCLRPYFQHMHILFDMHHVREPPYACEERERAQLLHMGMKCALIRQQRDREADRQNKSFHFKMSSYLPQSILAPLRHRLHSHIAFSIMWGSSVMLLDVTAKLQRHLTLPCQPHPHV